MTGPPILGRNRSAGATPSAGPRLSSRHGASESVSRPAARIVPLLEEVDEGVYPRRGRPRRGLRTGVASLERRSRPQWIARPGGPGPTAPAYLEWHEDRLSRRSWPCVVSTAAMSGSIALGDRLKDGRGYCLSATPVSSNQRRWEAHPPHPRSTTDGDSTWDDDGNRTSPSGYASVVHWRPTDRRQWPWKTSELPGRSDRAARKNRPETRTLEDGSWSTRSVVEQDGSVGAAIFEDGPSQPMFGFSGRARSFYIDRSNLSAPRGPRRLRSVRRIRRWVGDAGAEKRRKLSFDDAVVAGLPAQPHASRTPVQQDPRPWPSPLRL